MEIVMNVVNFVKDHGKDILAIVGSGYLTLLGIVKLTPTPKDDELLDKAYQFVHKIVGFFGVKK